MQHRLQRFVGRRWYFDECRRAAAAAPVHAVQHQAVKVNVQVDGLAKALNQSDRTRRPRKRTDSEVERLRHTAQQKAQAR